MAEPFIGEIRIMSFDYPPRGWAFCDGQFLPINQNQALFSLLGAEFGGNGQTNFALPDLRGRTPIHVGQGFVRGGRGGEEAHTLTLAEMPQHTHVAASSSASTGGNSQPAGRFLGSANNMYHSPTNLTQMNPSTIASAGGSQAHTNMQPYLSLNFCIALEGIFPSRN